MRACVRVHENVLLATEAQPWVCQRVVEEARNVPEEVCGIPVRCERADDTGVCQGKCMGQVCGAMGFCVVQRCPPPQPPTPTVCRQAMEEKFLLKTHSTPAVPTGTPTEP